LAVAAVFVWPSLPHKSDNYTPGQLPDFAAQPVWGDAIDLAELAGGDFAAVEFRGFLGEQTGLVVATSDVAVQLADEPGSPQADPPARLVAFDLDSGEPSWLIDVDKSLGEEFSDAYIPEVLLDPDGLIAVYAVKIDDGGFRYPAATIGASGEVLSKTSDIGGEMVGLGTGVVLVWSSTLGEEHQAAYDATDLGRPLWRAHAYSDSLSTRTHNSWTGTYWTAPNDQVVDVDTGQPTELRVGPFNPGVTFSLVHGPGDLVLRRVGEDGPVMLVDPATGAPLWESAAASAQGDLALETRGRTLLVGPTVRERSGLLWARDLATGTALWTGAGRIGAVRGDAALILRGQHMTTRKLRSGRELARMTLPPSFSFVGAGSATVYLQPWDGDRRELTAYALDGLEELWSIDTSPALAGADSVWYRWTESRLFAVYTFGERETIRELMPGD
jgi:hypothetical protein